MPPYGIDSLLNRNFDAEGFFESPVESTYDPAFGTLNYQTAYGPAPYTGNIPLTSYRVQPGIEYLSGDGTLKNLGFQGDSELPSFGGSGNPRFNQFGKDIDFINTPQNIYPAAVPPDFINAPQDIYPPQTRGIMKQLPLDMNRFQGVSDMSIIDETTNDEQDQNYINQVNKNKSGGLADLFKVLIGFAVPGANFFLNKGRGAMDGIRSLNQKIQQSDFGQSRTGTEYAMRRRERKQADRAQEAMPNVYRSAREQGFTNDRGGFSTSRADRAGTSLGSGQFSSKRSTGRQGY